MRREAVEKGPGTCGCCFDVHSLHSGGTVVQHGYRMAGAGWGHGHNGMWKAGGDCFGVGWFPFEKSPDCTAAYAKALHAASQSEQRQADMWRTGKITAIYEAVRPINRQKGWWTEHREERSSAPLTDREIADGWVVVVLTPAASDWRERVAKKVAFHVDQATRLEAEARWYDAAARGWPAYPAGTAAQAAAS